MDCEDNLNNFISGDGNDQMMDFLPIWMTNIEEANITEGVGEIAVDKAKEENAMEVTDDVAALKPKDAAPKPEDATPKSEDAAPKPEDAAQSLSDSNENSDEEPPLKKHKANPKPAGECSYGFQSVFKPLKYCHYNKCEAIFKHYCRTCQGFYCYRHGPRDLHRCSVLYPPLSSDEEVAEDDNV